MVSWFINKLSALSIRHLVTQLRTRRFSFSWFQHDLPEASGRDDGFVGAASIRQRDCFVDDGFKSSGLQPLDDCIVNGCKVRLRYIPQCESRNVGLPGHDIARGDLDVAATADDDDASVERDHREVVGEVLVGEHLDDDIYTFAVGDLQHFIFLAVVERVRSSLIENDLAAFVGAGGSNDGHAQRLCNLHGCESRASAGSVNENGLAFLPFRLVNDSAISGCIRNADGRTLPKRHMLGEPMKLRSFREGFLCIGSGKAAGNVNAIAFLERRYTFTDGGNDSCAVHSGSPRKLRLHCVGARTHHGLERIDPHGMNVDKDFACTGFRVSNLFKYEFLWTTKFVNVNHFHNYLLYLS